VSTWLEIRVALLRTNSYLGMQVAVVALHQALVIEFYGSLRMDFQVVLDQWGESHVRLLNSIDQT
jgi:hypothetical protein